MDKNEQSKKKTKKEGWMRSQKEKNGKTVLAIDFENETGKHLKIKKRRCVIRSRSVLFFCC